MYIRECLAVFMCVLMCVYPVRGCACAYVLEQVIMQDGYPFKQMNKRIFKNLDEIYAGACDGMTYEFAILFLLWKANQTHIKRAVIIEIAFKFYAAPPLVFWFQPLLMPFMEHCVYLHTHTHACTHRTGTAKFSRNLGPRRRAGKLTSWAIGTHGASRIWTWFNG